MRCKGSEDCPYRCCVHKEHAFIMQTQSYAGTQDAFKTALEKFDLGKTADGMANGFSEINLHQAVLDDTEKKLPPIKPAVRTVKLSIREMLRDGSFKSPSKAVLRKTVKQIQEAQRLKETARRRALMDKLKGRTLAQAKLNKMTRFMANLAAEEKESRERNRRLEMGLPPNMKFKSSLAKIRVANVFQTTTISSQQESVEPVKLPKIVKTSIEKLKVENNIIESENDEVKTCSSYGGFLSSEVGRSESTLNLPFISAQEEILGEVPSRPAYFTKEKKIKVPAYLERFRYMRIKN